MTWRHPEYNNYDVTGAQKMTSPGDAQRVACQFTSFYSEICTLEHQTAPFQRFSKTMIAQFDGNCSEEMRIIIIWSDKSLQRWAHWNVSKAFFTDSFRRWVLTEFRTSTRTRFGGEPKNKKKWKLLHASIVYTGTVLGSFESCLFWFYV